MFLYNCSNDLALASDTREYIPPKNIVRMESDLAALPAWWCSDGDAVLLDSPEAVQKNNDFIKSINGNIFITSPGEGYDALCKRAGYTFRPAPWGWSKAAVEKFHRFGMPCSMLPDESELDTIRNLSSKEFSVKYLKQLLSEAQKSVIHDRLLGSKMQYATDLKTLNIEERTIFKSPWSGSGRGVFAANSLEEPSIREKLSGFIRKQGGFITDKFYEKILDFAFEYNIDNDGTAHFIGYSLFTTADNGYYGYNIADTQSQLKKIITDSGIDDNTLDILKNLHCRLLQKNLNKKYHGALGIDMLAAMEDGILKIHPCVEINLRMNIGIAAMIIAEKHGCDNRQLTPPENTVFTANIENKKFKITYNPVNKA